MSMADRGVQQRTCTPHRPHAHPYTAAPPPAFRAFPRILSILPFWTHARSRETETRPRARYRSVTRAESWLETRGAALPPARPPHPRPPTRRASRIWYSACRRPCCGLRHRSLACQNKHHDVHRRHHILAQFVHLPSKHGRSAPNHPARPHHRPLSPASSTAR